MERRNIFMLISTFDLQSSKLRRICYNCCSRAYILSVTGTQYHRTTNHQIHIQTPPFFSSCLYNTSQACVAFFKVFILYLVMMGTKFYMDTEFVKQTYVRHVRPGNGEHNVAFAEKRLNENNKSLCDEVSFRLAHLLRRRRGAYVHKL